MEEDTRENLEADILKYYTHSVSTAMWPDSANIKTKYVSVTINAVLDWLDRQAAITERETAKQLEEQAAQLVNDKNYAEAELVKRDKGIERLKRRRYELEDELRQVKRKYSEKLADVRTLPSVERVRELEDELVRIRDERDELKAEQLSWPTMLQYKDACAERDAYRELCGRMRKMANEMLIMEVD